MSEPTLAVDLEKALRCFVQNHAHNLLAAHGNIRMYDDPLVGFAAADDPLFVELRKPEIVATEHLLPRELLPGARTAISYFLPFSAPVRGSNYGAGLPSEEWASARIEGEHFNDEVRRFLIHHLEGLGGRAVAPAREAGYRSLGVKSTWSERHVAYIAGLGTFGLSRSLITARGAAGRVGSVITTLYLPPTARAYRHHEEYCPYLTDGGCGECIDRCPSGAITRNGKDKDVCKNYIDTVVKPHFAPRYGCAKCQTGVRCETSRPD